MVILSAFSKSQTSTKTTSHLLSVFHQNIQMRWSKPFHRHSKTIFRPTDFVFTLPKIRILMVSTLLTVSHRETKPFAITLTTIECSTLESVPLRHFHTVDRHLKHYRRLYQSANIKYIANIYSSYGIRLPSRYAFPRSRLP